MLNETYPGVSVQTDIEILNAVQKSVAPLWHAAATSKMDTAGNPMATIDSSSKVFGTQEFSVVDASSFFLLPPGHPQSLYIPLHRNLLVKLGANNRSASMKSFAKIDFGLR